jgi:hypothetical protein
LAHWAEIDENNIVIRVTVGDNEDPNGDEGYQWLLDNLGGTWVKTSYNNNIRKNYAGIGFFYNKDLDAFIPPKPFNSWILDEETCTWIAPVEAPEFGGHTWDEETVSWKIIEQAV